jgi:hypothetical protein
MLKVNTSIHTIRLDPGYDELELFQGSVIPYLETNEFRPRLLAIQKTRPILYRAKVLGRALLATRTNPNRLWMLLSGNAEVAFSSTTAAAASITTPATAPSGASVDAATVAANHSTTALPAANVTAPTSGQNRKTCPEPQPGNE